MKIETFQSRDDWLAARATFLGASDTPCLFGYGYAEQGPSTVYAEKVSGRSNFQVTPRMRLGLYLEPGALQAHNEWDWQDDLPRCRLASNGLRIFRSEEQDYIACTPDALTEGGHPAEIKTLSIQGAAELQNHVRRFGEPPLQYQIQIQHQMLCLGPDVGWGLLVVNAANDDLYRALVPRNEKFVALLQEKCQWLWDHIQRRVVPPDDDVMALQEALKLLFPQDNAQAIELPAEAVDRYEQRLQFDEQEKEAAKAKKDCDNYFRRALGENAYGALIDGTAVSWKTQTRRAKTCPNCGHELQQESQSRVLRFHKSLPKGVRTP